MVVMDIGSALCDVIMLQRLDTLHKPVSARFPAWVQSSGQPKPPEPLKVRRDRTHVCRRAGSHKCCVWSGMEMAEITVLNLCGMAHITPLQDDSE
jgi:hypothetical protein